MKKVVFVIFLSLMTASTAMAMSFEQSIAKADAGGFKKINANDWVVIKATQCILGKTQSASEIYLCRSSTTHGEDQERDVDVVVISSHKVVYRFISGDQRGRAFVDNTLEIRDLTKDGYPEVIFKSGWQAVTDHGECSHILCSVYHPVLEKNLITDIAREDFESSSHHRFQFTIVNGKDYAIVADRLNSVGGAFSGMEQVDYQYLVYEWNVKIKNFAVCAAAISPDERSDPLREDEMLIKNSILKSCGG